MVELVRHTLLLGCVGFDVNVVSNLVGLHERRQLDHAAL